MPRVFGALIAAVLLAACSTPEPGEIVVSIEGSVSSLVTTTPEQTTTTARTEQVTTTLPGADPGACVAPGEVVIVALVTAVQVQKPCAVSTTGTLRFSNFTDSEVTVEWGDRTLRVAPQRSVSPSERVGEILSPGLHAFETSLSIVPTVLVEAPEEGFGSAVIGLRSFGGIRPGQRVSEAEAALDVSIVIQQRGARCSVGWIAGDAHSPILALDAADSDPIIVRAAATSASQLTLSGIGIGSTLDDLQVAYGQQLTGSDNLYAFEPNEAVDANYRLIFDVATADGIDTVTGLRIGQVGEVERTTTC